MASSTTRAPPIAPSEPPKAPRRPFTDRTRTLVLLLACGVIAAVVVFAVVLSSATFTAESDSAANDASAGSAALTVVPDDSIIDASQMKPNSVRTGTATVTNTGSRAIISVDVKGADAEPQLASVLNLKIANQDTPALVPYDGPLGGAGRVDLGTHQTDQSSAWNLTLSLPSTVDPVLGSKELAITFDWTARSP